MANCGIIILCLYLAFAITCFIGGEDRAGYGIANVNALRRRRERKSERGNIDWAHNSKWNRGFDREG